MEFYGKGPTEAKTYFNDNYVFCVMKGGLTRNEETLIARGEEMLVRQYRLRFQEAMAGPTTESIERVTGCRVLTYHQPDRVRPRARRRVLRVGPAS